MERVATGLGRRGADLVRGRAGLGRDLRRLYKTVNGLGFPYGDYDTMAINSASKTVAVMGEGDTSQINGDIWVNHQT